VCVSRSLFTNNTSHSHSTAPIDTTKEHRYGTNDSKARANNTTIQNNTTGQGDGGEEREKQAQRDASMLLNGYCLELSVADLISDDPVGWWKFVCVLYTTLLQVIVESAYNCWHVAIINTCDWLLHLVVHTEENRARETVDDGRR